MIREPDDPATPAILASDAERDQTIIVLREHCGEGRLTLEEFAERLEIVLQARTRTELDAVTRDLPVTALQPLPVVRAEPARARSRKRFIAILGSNTRGRRWRVPEQADAIAVLGECELDLREAVFTGESLELTAVAVLGEVSITVPEGMRVETSGFAILGENNFEVDDDGELRGMPVLHLRAYAVLGEVKVRARPRPHPPRA